MKSKGLSLIVDSGKEMSWKFIKMTEKGGEIPAILGEWEQKQKKLQKKGMEAKEIANLSFDKQRNSDLNKFSMMQGPFTTSEQVAIYMGREDVNEKEKG